MPAVDSEVTRVHLDALHKHVQSLDYEVNYYPEKPDQDWFGIAYTTIDGETVAVGDHDYGFPLHSVSKIFTYGVALEDNGREATLERVGAEPSGEAFNAIQFDERHNRPFNAMVNSGALVAANLVRGGDRDEKVARVLDKIRLYAGNPKLDVDKEVLEYELGHNDRNLGLSYLMRSLGMLEGDIEENLAVYLSICSVTITARDLAMMGATLANRGINPDTGERAVDRPYLRDLITVMVTCGMYDAAGQWAFDVGLPAKSGVGGGLVATLPGRFGLGLSSPGLDVYGHSARGTAVCRELSSYYGLHMFTAPVDDTLGDPTSPYHGK